MTPVRRNRGFMAVAMVVAAALAGCQSSSIDDFAPQPGVKNTGAFPDLNVRRQAETAQLTGAQADQKIAELKAAQASNAAQSGGPAPANPAEFTQAQKNQRKTLEEIEAE